MKEKKTFVEPEIIHDDGLKVPDRSFSLMPLVAISGGGGGSDVPDGSDGTDPDSTD
jgi:hypothetical protein